MTYNEHISPFEAARDMLCNIILSSRSIIKMCCFEKLQDALLLNLTGSRSAETKF
jgi:hypothetical protein